MTIKNRDELVIKLKSGEYDGTDIMQAWIRIEALEQQIERDKNAYESALHLLIRRSEPFLDSNIVDETSGTIPLMEALKHAIKLANELLKQDKEK